MRNCHRLALAFLIGWQFTGCGAATNMLPENAQGAPSPESDPGSGQINPPITQEDLRATDQDGDGLSANIELILGTSDVSADSDKNGVSDFDEFSVYSTDPTIADTDGDQLSDSDEVFGYRTDPRRPDTDSDGLTDGHEVNVTGTHPLQPDTDNDGLLDGEEMILGTDPRRWDSDLDDVGDKEEVLNGSDPLDPHDPPPPRPSSDLFSFLTPDEAELFEAQSHIAFLEVSQWYAREVSRIERDFAQRGAGRPETAVCNTGRIAGEMLVEVFERLLIELVESIPYQMTPADRREVGAHMHDRFDSTRECDLQDCSRVSVFCQLAR